MTKRQRIIPGAILEIETKSNFYYAQILESKGCAFFDIELDNPLKDFKGLNELPVLLNLRVYDDVITKGDWLKVAKYKIREDLMIEPDKFIQNSLNLELFELYSPKTGKISKAKKENCLG